MKIERFPFFLVFLFFSCSLKYKAPPYNEENTPEFVFETSDFTRVTDGKMEANVKSSVLEQYRGGAIYAKEANFVSYNSEGEVSGEGKSDFIFYDDLRKKGFLFGSIYIKDLKNDLFLRADELRWDGKSMQLVGSEKGNVEIEGKNLCFSGKGFSFSAISHLFSFSHFTSGEFEEEEK